MEDSTSTGLWGRLSERQESTTAAPAAASPNVWQVVEDRLDVAKMWPRRIDDFELAEVGGSAAGKRYMLKNRRTGAYLGLTEADVFLWNLMDGTNSVKSMVIELFVEHKRYAPDHVVQLIALLKAGGFLEARHTPVFESLTGRLLGRRWTGRVLAAVRFLTSVRLAIPNPDRHFSALHDRLGWLCYTPAGLAIGLVLFLADVVLFPYYLFVHNYQLLTVHGRYQWGFLAMLLVMAVSILVHECAHALTSKHFGREVNSAGIMFIFGLPAFHVDTTDMWMTRKWPRIAVSFAGPYANAMLGGLTLLVLALSPPSWPGDLIFEFATFNTLGCILNLVPNMEKDGDYILLDLLEVPRLRPRAFHFLRRGLWTKLRQREAFGKLDLILGSYGLIAVGGVLLTLVVGARLWLTSGLTLIQALLDNPVLAVEIGAPVVAVAVAVYLVRYGIPRLGRGPNQWRVLAKRLE
ncbi:MAG: hypothetical protein LC797_14140 [Chloroflexi bacterium]|nr:hypothetical protein [Chloroflexota bacterium]